MITKYKHIHFTKEPDMIRGNRSLWVCRNNNTKHILGYCTYHEPWKRYVFEGETDCIFDAGCLRDIIAFMQQLR